MKQVFWVILAAVVLFYALSAGFKQAPVTLLTENAPTALSQQEQWRRLFFRYMDPCLDLYQQDWALRNNIIAEANSPEKNPEHLKQLHARAKDIQQQINSLTQAWYEQQDALSLPQKAASGELLTLFAALNWSNKILNQLDQDAFEPRAKEVNQLLITLYRYHLRLAQLTSAQRQQADKAFDVHMDAIAQHPSAAFHPLPHHGKITESYKTMRRNNIRLLKRQAVWCHDLVKQMRSQQYIEVKVVAQARRIVATQTEIKALREGYAQSVLLDISAKKWQSESCLSAIRQETARI